MAVRYTANNEYLRQDSIITRLNYNDRYTMMVWYYLVAHHATVNMGFLWHCNTAITTYDAIGQESTSNGEQMYIADNVSGAAYTSGAIAAATWHHVSMVRCSSTLLRGFINGVQFGSDLTGNVGGRAAATRTYIGNPSGSYYISARFAHAKLWNVPLSPEEIQAEMWASAPVTNLGNVVVWSPLMAGNRNADFGPFGLPWTETGTLSDEADPEIPLRQAARVERVRRWWIPYVGIGYTKSMIANVIPLTYDDPISDPVTQWPTKRTMRTLAASLTPSGALSMLKAFLRTLAAGLTPTGNLVRRTTRTLTAGLTPTGALSQLKTLLRTLTASVAPLTYNDPMSEPVTQWPTKRTMRTLAASLTPSGALSYLKAFLRTLAAGLTPSGNLVRGVAHTLTAGLTPTGALSVIKALLRTLTAFMAPVTYDDPILTPVTLWPTKRTMRTLAAGLTPGGVLTPLKAFLRLLAASLTPSANVVKGTAHRLAAGLTPTGNVVKGTAHRLAASLTPSANVVKGMALTLTASLTPSGALVVIRAYLLILTASLTPSGGLVRGIARTLRASLMPLSSLLRLLSGVTGGRAKCTLTMQAATTAQLAMQNATTCGLELSEV